MEWEKEQQEKKDILGNERESECVSLCEGGVNVSTSQAETITSVGCLFLTHWANLIEAKHLNSSGNEADLQPVQSIQSLSQACCPQQLC